MIEIKLIQHYIHSTHGSYTSLMEEYYRGTHTHTIIFQAPGTKVDSVHSSQCLCTVLTSMQQFTTTTSFLSMLCHLAHWVIYVQASTGTFYEIPNTPALPTTCIMFIPGLIIVYSQRAWP